MTGPYYGINGDEITDAERKVIQSLARLAKRWPGSLTLVSMGGSLHAIHTNDPRFHDEHFYDRGAAVLYTFDGIPNDGGDW